MIKQEIKLKGITWNHTRGYVPMVATAQRFKELNPRVEIDWSIRSLQEFADKPVDKLSEDFDLLVIDHPWMGFVAEHEAFLKLDDYLPSDYLKDQSENSVGPSFESYSFNGSQWAIPLDAATPVAASRPDILKDNGFSLPGKFEEVYKLAEKGLVVFAGIPLDSLMNFYMFCSAYGEDPFETGHQIVSKEVGIKALKILRELALKVDPVCFEWDPIQVYEAMTKEDRFAYCPFAYGYVNYAKEGYARKKLNFHDLVSFKKSGRLKTTLGGAGLAISTKCIYPDVACNYLQFVVSAGCQSSIYFESGGQPGHQGAWTNDHTNAVSNDFFKATLPALDRAFLRPRYNGYMHFQENASALIQDYMINGGNEGTILDKLNRLYKRSLK